MPYGIDGETGERILTLEKIVYRGSDKLDKSSVFRIDTVVSYRTPIQNTCVYYDVKVENKNGVVFVEKHKGNTPSSSKRYSSKVMRMK
jgi:hypothetical protein